MLEKIWNQIIELNFPVLQLLIGVLGGFVSSWILTISLNTTILKSNSNDLRFFKKRCLPTLRLFIPVIFTFVALHYANESDWVEIMRVTFRLLLIVISGYLIIKLSHWMEDMFLDKYDINKEDNRKERKIITQLNFLKKTIIVGVTLITISIILLSFEEGRKYGQTLLTSAGVASIIIGFAAQKTLANFLAGIQIAFAQPIKLDDAVVVEGEWGWIEEINLTYVVVRIWDWRRLVLPITYFVEKPFQNWTRNKGEIIGSVILFLDYRTPIEELRQKLTELLNDEPKWDGQVNSLQVVDTKEYTMMVRALMSAKNSPSAWDLRCSIREKLLLYLKDNHPESLPVQRVDLSGNLDNFK